MDLLKLANRINAELSRIQARSEWILSELERASIFNSIITLLTEGLAIGITLSIRSRSGSRVYASWSYDLRDSTGIRRIGPDAEQLATVAERAPRDAYIDCQPQWSSGFRSMNQHRKSQVLKDTIWAEKTPAANESRELFEDRRSLTPDVEPDLRDLEIELRRLEAEIKNLIDKRTIEAALDSTRRLLLKQYIQGVEIALRQNERDLLSWRFFARPNGSLTRRGQPSIEQIIELARSMKKRPELVIRPVTTRRLNRMSPKEQRLAMKDTIWAPLFSKQAKRGILPW